MNYTYYWRRLHTPERFSILARIFSRLFRFIAGSSKIISENRGQAPRKRMSVVDYSAQAGVGQDRVLHVVIPLYKQEWLIRGLFRSLIENAAEIVIARGIIILVIDSPEDDGLRQAIDLGLPDLQAYVTVRLIINETNLGFVGAANRAMAQAVEENADVLLLNSDALITSGAIMEMRAVAAGDPADIRREPPIQ